MTDRSKALPTAVLVSLTTFLGASTVRADEPAPAPSSAAPAPEPAAAIPAEVMLADVEPPSDPADTPAPAVWVLGSARSYTPLLRFEPKGLTLQGDFLLAFRGEGVSTFPVEREGTGYQVGAVLAPMLRAGVRFDTGTALKHVNLHVEYEHDLPTGYWTSDTPIQGVEMPGSAPIEHQLRKLYLRASLGPWLHVGGGFMTNQFGLGLLANDGAQGNWTPGSARFADNRGGDRVLRGFLGTGPLTDAGLTATFAIDKVQGDDVMLPGDEAYQIIGTASVGYGKPWGAGIFVVQRHQDAAGGARSSVPMGPQAAPYPGAPRARTDATVVDLTARYARMGPSVSYSIEGEVAFVTGETTLAPTTDFPVHRLRQVGGVVRAAARGNHAGGVLDFLYLSGDGNPDDEVQSAFKADPNFETGLLLYRHVLAAQTGRGAVTAANPELVGVPAEGLERVPTRGSPTNSVALYPRVYYRPVAGLEGYAGVLLAWSPAPLSDPLNTRLGGGVARNALDGASGSFLGAELDLGVRHRMLFGGTELTLGVEGAVFLPGDAFADAAGNTMGPVLGGRALFNYRL